MTARLEATHDGGGSHPEEQLGLAAEVRKTNCRQENPERRVFE
jgi:hypothetical protein